MSRPPQERGGLYGCRLKRIRAKNLVDLFVLIRAFAYETFIIKILVLLLEIADAHPLIRNWASRSIYGAILLLCFEID